MRFEWDTAKALANLRKHGLGFEEAARVFIDPDRVEAFDGREPYGEDRWRTVGQVATVILTVVYTIRNEAPETIRLISARRANRHEQAQYYQVRARH